MSTHPSLAAADLCAHGEALRRLARALVGDGDRAQDVVQDAFAAALEQPPRSHAALPAWLKQVVRRCSLDLRRGDARRAQRERAVARSESTAADAAESLAVQHEILAAVRALREPYRTAVWLRYYEDLSPMAIAERLGEPVKTIKTRLWRALRSLRQVLDRPEQTRNWRAALLPLAVASPDAKAIGAAWAIGAWIMQMTKTTLAVAGVLVALGLWWMWSTVGAGGVDPRVPGVAPQARPRESTTASRTTAAEREATGSVPATARPDIDPYGSLLVRAAWHDGQPAAEVAILFEAQGEPALDRDDLRVVTDAEGVARAARLHAGTVVVTSDRGGEAKVEVVAGAERETLLTLSAGIDVEGLVEDAAGRPVVGARIWLATSKVGWMGGRVIGTSAGDGSFRIRSVDRRHSLGALAAGCAPSKLVDLEDVATDPGQPSARVRLRLLRTGAAFEGQVHDENGRAVADALVAVGTGRHSVWSSNGRQQEYWTPEVVVTGPDGRFRCDSVEPGVLPVTVRAEGYALWTDKVPAAPGQTARITVTLDRGVTVQGLVANEQGEPVAGAYVLSLQRPVIKALLISSPQNVQDRGAFALPFALSDAQGRYRLRCVPAGDVHLLATKMGRADSSDDKPQGTCQHRISGRSDDQLTWNPVLSLGLTIPGRVVQADGKAWRGPLEATPDRPAEGAELLFAYARDRGEFSFSHCVDVPYTVALARVAQPAGVKWVYESGVQPGGPEVVLRVPRIETAESGLVHGRIVDNGRRVSQWSELKVSLVSDGWREARLQGDRFTSSALPPGRYRVMVQAKEDLILNGPWFELPAGQRLDVGDLVTEPGTSIAVALRVAPGLELGSPRGDLRLSGGGAWHTLRWDGRRLRADNVTVGGHRLLVSGGAWHARPRDVTLVAGQETEVEVELAPSALRTLEIAFPLPDRWRLGSAVLRDAQGVIVAEQVGLLASSIGMRPVSWRRQYPLGTFTLEATTDAGHRKSWPVDLRDPATAERVLRFSLR